MSKSKRIWIPAVLAVLFQILNLTLIGPGIAQSQGVVVGNTIYVLLRVAAVLAFAFLATSRYDLPRFRAIAWASFIDFLAQVPVQAVWRMTLAKSDPALWGNPGLDALLWGLGQAFAALFPLIFGLAFVGAELGLRKQVQKT